MSCFGSDWDEGTRISYFECETQGPEERWCVEMKSVRTGEGDEEKFYTVVYDPFANRLMWFDDDRKETNFEARMAFKNLVELALCDACVVRWAHGGYNGNG